tara:strand:+ start:1644 stop:2501 length:858 start_codon:yes stop_codon:yes gene_type:complete
MPQANGTSRTRDPVPGVFTYVVNDGRRPVARNNEQGRIDYENVILEEHEVPIHNARPNQTSFSLEQNGFQLLKHVSAVSDFRDETQLNTVYHPEMEALIKSVTGAARVHVFDHTLRTGDEGSEDASWMRETVNHVHNDYTDRSGPQRVRDLFPDEAEELLQHRFAVIQVWRGIRSPVEKSPLAMCDAGSISTEDLIVMERSRPAGPGSTKRVGELYHLSFNADHRWYYFPNMTSDEVLIFKTFDSDLGNSARFTAHAAFEDPTCRPDAPERVSIDVRAFAFFGSP